ncbi:MAG TPA: hypothetical protein VK106_06540 [Balneolaceae bacterium]|nr:hypothetical protein [Balneolaceae bacterium]
MKNVVKEEIVEWITKPENEELLKALKLIKESQASGDWFERLDEQSKQSIKKGLKEHQNDNTLTNEEFWLKHG